MTKEDILAYLEQATILELNDLVEAIEEKFGVTAAAAVAAAPVEEAANDEPTEVSVVISSFGEKKVQVIKVVREITGLGLLDAKKLVEAIPATVKENVPTAEAEEIKNKLVEAGATVEYK